MAERDTAVVPWPVVVVDDDPLARALVVRCLRALGLSNPVVEVVDGDDARAVLAGMLEPPVLVLLDLELPGRNGLEVLSWMRSDPHLCSTPVVMLTGSAELEDVDAAYELGILSYLVKPVGFEALQDVVRTLAQPWALVPDAEA